MSSLRLGYCNVLEDLSIQYVAHNRFTIFNVNSGAGTNLKEGTCPTQKAGNFFVVALHFLGSTSTISRFCERFCDGQYSLVSFLFAVLLLTVTPCPAMCKNGGACPIESGPLIVISKGTPCTNMRLRDAFNSRNSKVMV